MNIKDYFRSSSYKWTVLSLLGVICVLSVFQIGEFVGYHKASASFQWADNYHRIFGAPQGVFLNDMKEDEYANGHGLSGTVLQTAEGALTVQSMGNMEMMVYLPDGVAVRRGRFVLQAADIHVDDRIVIIGPSNPDGSITAKMIRIF